MTILSEEGKFYENWVDLIPACLASLRFLHNRSHGYAPFEVLHGLSPRVPLK